MAFSGSYLRNHALSLSSVQVNPLLVVNHKTNVRSNAGAMTDPRLRPRPVTRVVVEAATAFKHTL